MRRLLLSLLVMLALAWVVDRAIGHGMESLFRSSTALEDGDVLRRSWDYKAPIVVCGSSRATHHYVVDSLGSMLGTRAYNLGRDGCGGSVFMYGVAGIITRHYTPKLWIMDAGWSLDRGPEQTGRLSCFLPYVDDEPVAREVVGLCSKYEGLRLLSKTYHYNSLILSLLSPRMGKQVHPRFGFLPVQGAYTPAPPTSGPGPPEDEWPAVDTLKVRYLRQTVELLRSRGVTVLAVQSPRFFETPGDERDILKEEREMEQVFGRLQVRYLDLSALRLARFRDPGLFKDRAHLNETGALIFTRILADSLRAMRLGS